jgi:hypothetical protein
MPIWESHGERTCPVSSPPWPPPPDWGGAVSGMSIILIGAGAGAGAKADVGCGAGALAGCKVKDKHRS